MRKIFYLIFLSLFFSSFSYGQSDNAVHVIGDSLVGKNINGNVIREVYNNVVITQGNVKITCDRATQFITENRIEVIGNVILTQDSVILKAERGDYNLNKEFAFFENNVNLTDSIITLTSDSLYYYKNNRKMIAIGNVIAKDSINIIYSDSLNYFKDSSKTIADRNVIYVNQSNNTKIYSGHLENYLKNNHSIVSDNPVLIQIDFTKNNNDNSVEIDTLLISAEILESFGDSTNLYKAIDSVTIIRGGFASKNEKTFYFKKQKRLVTTINKKDNIQPILWYDNTQITGDSIDISFDNNKIKSLFANNNVFIISQNTFNKKRFDQTSGDSLLSVFENGKLKTTNVYGSVLSIYFQYDNEEQNGVTKSSAKTAKMYFKKNQIQEIRMYGTPNSEYYPEKMVKGKEQTFVLPNYIPFKNKPNKIDILKYKKLIK